MKRYACSALALLALMQATAASAEVKESSDSGFTVSHVQTVAASPDKVWAALVAPARWWSSAHSWSGNAANLSLDAKVGAASASAGREAKPNMRASSMSPKGSCCA